jgi:hypothetical protein
LGERAGYTPGIDGSDDGDGKGAKGCEVIGMIDGPGSVSTLVPKVVSTEGDRGELLFPEYELAGLDVDFTEVDDDFSGRLAGGDDGPGWVNDKDEGSGKEDEDKMEEDAETRAATRRAKMAADHMDVDVG